MKRQNLPGSRGCRNTPAMDGRAGAMQFLAPNRPAFLVSRTGGPAGKAPILAGRACVSIADCGLRIADCHAR